MVQTDVSQLSAECQEWRQILRNYRDEFQLSRKSLQEICRKSLSKDQLLELEHFDNQFHIQLINIHDLKQSIKNHDRKMNFEKAAFDGNVNEDSIEQHEDLLDAYQSLEQTLTDLRSEFSEFLRRTGNQSV